jgi:hypothetical protein
LGGHTGSVTKWQYSTAADFSGPVDIASTSTTLTSILMGNLTQNRYYRAVVQSGVCAAVNSSALTITVLPAAAGGAPTVAVTNYLFGSFTLLIL